MFDFSPIQLIIVLVIALVVLGPKRLPDAAKSLGKGLREFKRSIAGDDDDDDVTVTAATADVAVEPTEPAVPPVDAAPPNPS